MTGPGRDKHTMAFAHELFDHQSIDDEVSHVRGLVDAIHRHNQRSHLECLQQERAVGGLHHRAQNVEFDLKFQ